MSERMIKMGVLGAGRVVQNRYVDVFRNELQGVQVLYVCDPVLERAQKVAQTLGAKAVAEMQPLLDDSDVDAILVGTESGNHFKHAMAALRAKKHVIVEKPPALLPEQVIQCEDYAKTNGLMYAVIFQNRLNPAIQILKRTFDEGRFGKIVLSTIRLRWCRYQDYYEDGWHGTWSMDGGVISQQAIHHVDALQWICGPVKELFAMQSNALNRLEAEDTTVATVQFANGSLGVIEATTAARPDDYEASISIVGEEGYVLIDGIALNKISKWRFVKEQPEDKLVPQQYSQEVPTGYGLSHGPLMQQIVDRLRQGRIDPPITGRDTVPTVQLVHALYRSVELGQKVNLSERPLSQRLGRKQPAMVEK